MAIKTVIGNNKRRKGMNIEIGDYRITNDSLQYILSEKKIYSKKSETPGVIYYTNETYHKNLDDVINWVIRARLLKSDATTLVELKNDLQVIRDDVKRYFEEV